MALVRYVYFKSDKNTFRVTLPLALPPFVLLPGRSLAGEVVHDCSPSGGCRYVGAACSALHRSSCAAAPACNVARRPELKLSRLGLLPVAGSAAANPVQAALRAASGATARGSWLCGVRGGAAGGGAASRSASIALGFIIDGNATDAFCCETS